MQFIGREAELSALEREYTRSSSFVVIYGRRRVGKTTLIKEFIKDKSALYFLATEEVESLARKRLLSAVAAYTGQDYLGKATLNDWVDIFSIIVNHNRGQRKILVIDEFQYLVQANPAFTSIFQKIWDETLSKSNTMVILCGSLISLMTTRVLNYSSPLYGRRTAQIRLMPFKFSELRAGLPQKTFKDLVDLYALTGGVPKYLEFFDNNQTLHENISHNILSKSGYLYEEPLFLLEKEVREPLTYFSIIKTIAAGKHKLNDIATSMELKANRLSPYLKTLAELGLVEKRVPVTEPNPHKSRKGLYFISDSFIRFWFAFIYPYKNELEIDQQQRVLERIKHNFVDNFLSFVFEEVCRDIFLQLCKQGHLAFSPTKTGAYWDGSQANEIDLVSVDEANRQIFFGECKYLQKQQMPLKTYAALQRKAKTPVFEDYSPQFILFSVSGFNRRLVEIAAANSSLVLVNQGIIV